MTELIGPPPDGAAPLDQFCAVLLLNDQAAGRPPNELFERINDQLLQFFREKFDNGRSGMFIREMIDCGG